MWAIGISYWGGGFFRYVLGSEALGHLAASVALKPRSFCKSCPSKRLRPNKASTASATCRITAGG